MCRCHIFLLKRIRVGVSRKSITKSPEHQHAQELYDQRHEKNEEEIQSLTLEERIELSWAFLLNITEQVMSRFSQSDQEKVIEAGHKLSQNGARYIHNVSEEARAVQNIVKTRDKIIEVDQSRSV